MSNSTICYTNTSKTNLNSLLYWPYHHPRHRPYTNLVSSPTWPPKCHSKLSYPPITSYSCSIFQCQPRWSPTSTYWNDMSTTMRSRAKIIYSAMWPSYGIGTIRDLIWMSHPRVIRMLGWVWRNLVTLLIIVWYCADGVYQAISIIIIVTLALVAINKSTWMQIPPTMNPIMIKTWDRRACIPATEVTSTSEILFIGIRNSIKFGNSTTTSKCMAIHSKLAAWSLSLGGRSMMKPCLVWVRYSITTLTIKMLCTTWRYQPTPQVDWSNAKIWEQCPTSNKALR